MNDIKKQKWNKILFCTFFTLFVLSVILHFIYDAYFVSIISFVLLYLLSHFAFITTNARFYVTGNLEKVEAEREVKKTGYLYFVFALMYMLCGILAVKSRIVSQLNIANHGYDWIINIILIIFIIALAVQGTRKK